MIEWDQRGSGYVHCPGNQFDDMGLLHQMTRPDYVTKVAIDAPFGWPQAFVESILAYQHGSFWPDPPGSSANQQALRLRATDLTVREVTKLKPLSVSTDRIGVVAMRCARLLAATQTELDVPVDRSGEGRFLEVYPAATLLQWDLSTQLSDDPGSYKGPEARARARREWIIESLRRATAGWLEIGEKTRVVCVDSDHCLDALIASLTARAAERDALLPIGDLEAAQIEGWIRLPRKGSLASLGVL